MHARAGTPNGVLSHTVSSEAWHELWFNGVAVGETGINAADFPAEQDRLRLAGLGNVLAQFVYPFRALARG